MTTREALSEYYRNSPFDENETLTQDWVQFYAGKRFISVPNFKMRKRLIQYHDLGHMLTKYSNSRVGEGEVSAWELGSGICHCHPSAFFGIFGLATGIRFSPSRMKKAFFRGRNSKYLLKYPLEEFLDKSYQEAQEQIFNRTRNCFSKIVDWPLFILCFVSASLLYPFLIFVSVLQNNKSNAELKNSKP